MSLKPGIAIVVNESSVPVPEMAVVDADICEMPLLLPRWQAVALQSAAKQHGLTIAQMLRRMIGAVVGAQPPTPAR